MSPAKRQLMPLLVLVILVAAAAVHMLIRDGDEVSETSGLGIVTSVLPHAYLAERVGGERVTVTAMIPPGASPATYEPTPAQMKTLERARIYVAVGHPLFPFEQTWFKKVLEGRPDLQVVHAAATVDLIEDDPHIWTSPAAAAAQVRAILDALLAVDPGGEFEYRQRAVELLTEISALDSLIRQQLFPVRGRKFLAMHPAWGYFARDYGLVQVAIEHHFKAPGAREIDHLVEQAVADKIAIICVQSGVDRRAAESIAARTGAKVVELDPLNRELLDNLRRVATTFAEELR